MKKIRITGYIGYDYSSGSIADDLREAGGEDLDIHIASPGGSVFDGIDIFNQIRDYKRDNPKSRITVTLKGLAASMASYIAAVPVADKVRAEDNAVFMIHNPWSFAVGDHKEMQKTADFLSGLASILAVAYVRRTGKTKADISAMMDKETWLFGDEIKDAGFVDEIVESTDDNGKPAARLDKNAAIGAARVEFAKMQKTMKDLETPEDIDKAAALIRPMVSVARAESVNFTDQAQNCEKQTPGVAGEQNHAPEGEERGISFMTLEELKTKEPALYAEALAAGEKQERDKVSKCLVLMAKPSIKAQEGIVEAITNGMAAGKPYDEIAVAASDMLTAALESPPPVKVEGVDSASGEVAGASGDAKEFVPGQVEEV